jgi:hypothetical protein
MIAKGLLRFLKTLHDHGKRGSFAALVTPPDPAITSASHRGGVSMIAKDFVPFSGVKPFVIM